MVFEFKKRTMLGGKIYEIGEQIEMPDAKAKSLESRSFGKIVKAPVAEVATDDIAKMTAPQLKSLAESKGINTKSITKKADLIKAIEDVAKFATAADESAE